jgi:hypothetical protein
VLEGYKTMSYLPSEEEWCLLHPKTIKRQEKQNKYYEEKNYLVKLKIIETLVKEYSNDVDLGAKIREFINS